MGHTLSTNYSPHTDVRGFDQAYINAVTHPDPPPPPPSPFVPPSLTTDNMNSLPGTHSTFATSVVSELTPRQFNPSSNFPTSGPHDPGTSNPYANPYDNPQSSYYVPEATTLAFGPYPSGPYPNGPGGAGNQIGPGGPGGPSPGNPSGGGSSFPGSQPQGQGVQSTPPLKQPGVIAGIIIGTLILLFALIALILFLLRRRRLRQQAAIEPPPRA